MAEAGPKNLGPGKKKLSLSPTLPSYGFAPIVSNLNRYL